MMFFMSKLLAFLVVSSAIRVRQRQRNVNTSESGSQLCTNFFVQGDRRPWLESQPAGQMDFQENDSANIHDLFRRHLTEDHLLEIFARGYLANLKYQVLASRDFSQATKDLVEANLQTGFLLNENARQLATLYLKCKIAAEKQGFYEMEFFHSFQQEDRPSEWRRLGWESNKIPLSPDSSTLMRRVLNMADFALQAWTNAAICVLEQRTRPGARARGSLPEASYEFAFGELDARERDPNNDRRRFSPQEDPLTVISLFGTLSDSLSETNWNLFPGRSA